jgi:putative transposase
MITAGTFQKALHFQTDERLKFLHDHLLTLAKKYGWTLQSWAVFANHYHFIARSPQDPTNLAFFLSHLHVTVASYVNDKDNCPGRRALAELLQLEGRHFWILKLNMIKQN